jgi:sigma-B regulation protein RsbU (phosphoserine phosphatase)
VTGPATHGVLASRLHDIEALADAALSRLDEQRLLAALLERVKTVLRADTATVLLLDRSASQLVPAAASGIEEEVWQGIRVPLGRVSSAGSPRHASRSS